MTLGFGPDADARVKFCLFPKWLPDAGSVPILCTLAFVALSGRDFLFNFVRCDAIVTDGAIIAHNLLVSKSTCLYCFQRHDAALLLKYCH